MNEGVKQKAAPILKWTEVIFFVSQACPSKLGHSGGVIVLLFAAGGPAPVSHPAGFSRASSELSKAMRLFHQFQPRVVPMPLLLLALVFVAARLTRAQAVLPVSEAGRQATVLVSSPDVSAAGFCFSQDGYFATTRDVADGIPEVAVMFNSGQSNQKLIHARVVLTDKNQGLAILKADADTPFPFLPLGSTTGLRDNQSLLAIGFEKSGGIYDSLPLPPLAVVPECVGSLVRAQGVLQSMTLCKPTGTALAGGPVLDAVTGEVVGILPVSSLVPPKTGVLPVEGLRAMMAQPRIVFQPQPISFQNAIRAVDFRIGLRPDTVDLNAIFVKISLYQQGRVGSPVQAHRKGRVFVASAVPLPPGYLAAPPSPSGLHFQPVHYWVSVTLAPGVEGLAHGTLSILDSAIPATAMRSDGKANTPARLTAGIAASAPALHPLAKIPPHGVVPLPARLDDLAVGGGGRYLILSLRSLRQLAVFDMNTANIVHAIPIGTGNFHFAAGARSLIVYKEDSHIIERWSLDTFQRQLTVAAPNWPPLRDMQMGSASDGPLVVELGDGSVHWLSGTTLSSYQPNLAGQPYGWGGSSDLNFRYRLSPDGTLMLGWVEGISPRTLVSARFHPDHTDFITGGDDGYNGRTFTVGDDKNLIYASNGLHTLDMTMVNPSVLEGIPCLPVTGGAFFLGVRGTMASLYTVTDKRLLLTLPKLSELDGEIWDLEKQIFLVPRANLLVTVPTTRDQLMVRRFDLREQLKASGIDYLYVQSVPPATFQPGRQYAYHLGIQSKRGGVRCTLESGPPSMSLSKTGLLTWRVPARYVGDEEHVVVSVQDASGQQIYHTFLITPAVRGRE